MLKPSTIGCNILIIEKYFKLFLKYSLKEYELNTAEGMVLLALYGHNGQTEDQTLKNLDEDSVLYLLDNMLAKVATNASKAVRQNN